MFRDKPKNEGGEPESTSFKMSIVDRDDPKTQEALRYLGFMDIAFGPFGPCVNPQNDVVSDNEENGVGEAIADDRADIE